MAEENGNQEEKKERRKKVSVGVFIILLILFLSFPLWLTLDVLSFKKEGISFNDVAQLLGALIVIALFLERALDVFLTTWRAQESEVLSSDIDDVQNFISDLEEKGDTLTDEDRSKLNDLMGELKQKKKEKLKYSSDTRLYAMWTGLLFGVLISVIGIRTLRTFFDPGSLGQLEGMQEFLFNLSDILLTGGLIAGGSDGIHKIAEFYRIFMEKSSEKARNVKKK